MKIKITYIAPLIAAAAIGAIGLAPVASAAVASATPQQAAFVTGEDPLVPNGADPHVPYRLGFYNPNLSDGAGTTNPAGGQDLPF
jgi:hypothetical protein